MFYPHIMPQVPRKLTSDIDTSIFTSFQKKKDFDFASSNLGIPQNARANY